MIMNQLYPIGTQLITRRLSQAVLYCEIFDEGVYSLIEGEKGNFKPFTGKYHWMADAWRITVTKDNQTWLSPVPMVGDYYTKQNAFWNYILYQKFGDFDREIGEWCSGGIEAKEQIVKRLYPNGQRAPLIEWDEVILPKTEGE
jgi:hypothetical protein